MPEILNQVANIKVFGVGGGGSNAVNRMVHDGVQGVTFYICNTDVQVMKNSPCENRIVLGKDTTKGLGAGGNPEFGRKAAEEAESEIWGRDIDPNDENEFWAIVRRMDIESLKAEFGLDWE